MLIRAYHGYSQGPYGDFLDDLKAEAAKFLQAQSAPVVQQLAPQPAPQPMPVSVTPQPVQRDFLSSSTTPQKANPPKDGISPIVLLGLGYLAYKMLKKR